jgi:hypothetical protein
MSNAYSTRTTAGAAKSRAEIFSFALAVVLTPPVVFHEAMRLIHAQHISGTANLASAVFPSVVGAGLAFCHGERHHRHRTRRRECDRPVAGQSYLRLVIDDSPF